MHHVRSGTPSPSRVFLVHGEAEAQDAFAAVLRSDGLHVEIPDRMSHVTI
jgi:predicted metal-dependent RNase